MPYGGYFCGQCGMREAGDVMVWMYGQVPEDLQAAIRELRRTRLLEGTTMVQTVSRSLPAVASAANFAALLIREFVGCDAKEPWPDASVVPPETTETSQCPFERGRSDVLSHRGVTTASPGKRVDADHIASVDLGERVGVDPRLFDELSLVEQGVVVRLVIHGAPA
mgnify:CR=1 FL=1